MKARTTVLAFFLLATPVLSNAQVVINEALSSSGRVVGRGSASDWIELRNLGATPVDLGGYTLSDKKSKKGGWTIPRGTAVAKGGYLLIQCGGEGRGLRASFLLSSEGETIWLRAPDKGLVDSLKLPALRPGCSFGRASGPGNRLVIFENPTPGSANQATGLSGEAAPPRFSPPGGFYSENQLVSIVSDLPGSVVRYTLDGSEPTEAAPVYSTPLVAARARRTTQKYGNNREDGTGIQHYRFPDSLSYPTDRYSGERDFGFIVKAKVFQAGYLPSVSAASSYFIGMRKPDLPVVSLMTEPAGFFGAETGIYIQGRNGLETTFRGKPLTANWNRDWERPVFFEYFDEGAS
ncbi:MAG: lamin tail domain-containing protein [Spirochaetales bacterium]|nr:lamin tail domain-containing protein [Spirochaetales bacterium]